MSEVFLCKTGQLTASSKSQLRKAGIVVVEVDDPSTCQFIQATTRISGDQMLAAAISALRRHGGGFSSGDVQRQQFMSSMFDLIQEACAPQPEVDS